jgi:hypothetical protein
MWDQPPDPFLSNYAFLHAEGPAVAPGWRCPGSSGSLGQGGATPVASAGPRMPGGQAVTSASTGAVRVRARPPLGGQLAAFSTRRACGCR